MEVQFDFRIFEMCKTTYIIFHWFTICQKALAKQRYQCPYRIISMFRHSQFLSTKRFQKPCLQPWNEWRSVAIKIPPPFMSNFNYWISEYKPLWNIVKKKNWESIHRVSAEILSRNLRTPSTRKNKPAETWHVRGLFIPAIATTNRMKYDRTWKRRG